MGCILVLEIGERFVQNLSVLLFVALFTYTLVIGFFLDLPSYASEWMKRCNLLIFHADADIISETELKIFKSVKEF